MNIIGYMGKIESVEPKCSASISFGEQTRACILVQQSGNTFRAYDLATGRALLTFTTRCRQPEKLRGEFAEASNACAANTCERLNKTRAEFDVRMLRELRELPTINPSADKIVGCPDSGEMK